jgi:hypothetical protein
MAVQEGTCDITPFALSHGATIAYRLIPLLTTISVFEKNRPLFHTLKPKWMVYGSFLSQMASAQCKKGKQLSEMGSRRSFPPERPHTGQMPLCEGETALSTCLDGPGSCEIPCHKTGVMPGSAARTYHDLALNMSVFM